MKKSEKAKKASEGDSKEGPFFRFRAAKTTFSHEVREFLSEIDYFCNAEESNGRVVSRANNNANANGGLAYANTNNASSNSNTNNGSRLN